AFKPAGARIEPPSAQEDLPLRPVRHGGKAAARSIVVGMDRRHRRPTAAAIARQCCEFCEHRSPRFHCAAEPVSAKESDRLVAVAYPNAAVRLASMSCGAADPVELTRPASPKEVLPIRWSFTVAHSSCRSLRSDGRPLRLLPTRVKLASTRPRR